MNKYGWVKDLPDFRDFKYSLGEPTTLPDSVDLRNEFMPAVYDQNALGSCTSNGIAAAIRYDQAKNKNEYIFNPSRLFIYYQERAIENSIMSDSGAQIRDGIKACASVGAPPEYRWGYDITKFTQNPPASAYLSASQHKIKNYSSVQQDLNSIQTVLSQGFPIVFGISVYSSFETEEVMKTGVVPMPVTNDSMIGGHCILLCGYFNETKQFLFRNSWGTSFGDNGYGRLPYDYVTSNSLASDFWVINTTN